MNNQYKYPQNRTIPQTGKKIQNFIYQYNDLIGKGNFAKVYKGINLNTQQIVAIKLISLDQLKCKHLEALVFEQIRILQLMNHPNVLRFIEALLSERNCYIVTELCNDGNLDDRLKKRIPFSDQQLNRIVLDIYQGLKYLREKNVTHRDLKPANIFISNGRMKIADYGLAKFYRQRFKDLDIGSPQYMSPEGLNLNVYSQKTDIWSFGIIMYELLHGEGPFVFCQSEQQIKYYASRPIPQNRWRKDINPAIRQFVNRMLEIDQNKRPNIYQLANQPYLRALLEKEEGVLLPTKSYQKLQMPLPQKIQPQQPSQELYQNRGSYQAPQLNGYRQPALKESPVPVQKQYASYKSNSQNSYNQATPPRTFMNKVVHSSTLPAKINDSPEQKQLSRLVFSNGLVSQTSFKKIPSITFNVSTTIPHNFIQRPMSFEEKTNNSQTDRNYQGGSNHSMQELAHNRSVEHIYQRDYSQTTQETNQSEEERRLSLPPRHYQTKPNFG